MTEIRLLTREMVARRLNTSLRSLDKMIDDGIVPAPVRLGGMRRCYWHPVPFEAWFDRTFNVASSVKRPPTALSTEVSGEAASASPSWQKVPPRPPSTSTRSRSAGNPRAQHRARMATLNQQLIASAVGIGLTIQPPPPLQP